MTKALVTIDIFDDMILLTNRNGDIEQKRTISVDGLAQAVVKDFKLDTGILPTIQGVARYVKHNNNVLLYYQVAEQRRKIKYRDGASGTYDNVIMPWCVFVMCLRQQSDGKYHLGYQAIYALKGPILLGTDTLYRFPMTNVHSNGGICWGSHPFPSVWQNMAGVSGLVEQFFSSNFNDHLEGGQFKPKVMKVKGKEVNITAVHTLINALNEADEFPYDILSPYKSITNYHQSIERELMR